jgi:hypothetical protein
MNKKLTLAFVIISAISGFSHELTIPPQQIVLQEPKTVVTIPPPQIMLQEQDSLSLETYPMLELTKKNLPQRGSIYFRAMTDAEPDQGPEIFPGFGFGFRTSSSSSGFDVSANYSYSEVNLRHKFWTAPKISYLHYVSPNADQSLYGGFGIAWGGTSSKNKEGLSNSRFRGLIPHLTIGFEMLRNSVIFSFTEFTLSQPLFPSTQLGVRPGLIGELSVGAGF